MEQKLREILLDLKVNNTDYHINQAITKIKALFPKTKFNIPTECQCIRQLGNDEWDRANCQIHK
jgi:hypothetical protein